MFNLSNLSWLLYSSAPGWLSVTSWENIDAFEEPTTTFPIRPSGICRFQRNLRYSYLRNGKITFFSQAVCTLPRISKAYTHSRNHEPAHSSKSIYSERLFFSHRVRRFLVYNDFPLSSILKGELVKWVASTLYSKSSLIPFEAPSNKSMSRTTVRFLFPAAMWMAYANGIGWRSSVFVGIGPEAAGHTPGEWRFWGGTMSAEERQNGNVSIVSGFFHSRHMGDKKGHLWLCAPSPLCWDGQLPSVVNNIKISSSGPDVHHRLCSRARVEWEPLRFGVSLSTHCTLNTHCVK